MFIEKEVENTLKSDKIKNLVKKVVEGQTKILHDAVDRAWERDGFLTKKK